MKKITITDDGTITCDKPLTDKETLLIAEWFGWDMQTYGMDDDQDQFIFYTGIPVKDDNDEDEENDE